MAWAFHAKEWLALGNPRLPFPKGGRMMSEPIFLFITGAVVNTKIICQKITKTQTFWFSVIRFVTFSVLGRVKKQGRSVTGSAA